SHQALVREMILQLKRGHLDAEYFSGKFDVDILDRWRDVWTEYAERQFLSVDEPRIALTREGLLQVDGMLPAFFEPEHQGVRYT
ncbi:MAG: coproporphyrinogen III oxidase, partial [Planctomycetota bacterium]